MKMRMSRLQHLAILFFVAVHLLLFAICPVSGRIYKTNDAVVIEVDDVRPSLSPFAIRNFANPAPIPMTYAVNPYTGLSYLQQPNFPFWPYPLYQPASSFSDVEKVTAITADSRQQKISCGVGPATPPQRATPVVGIVGGSTAEPNSWPFIVGLRLAGRIRCGGSIISTTRILTAAHCVADLSAFQISTLTVSLGMHNQTANDAQQTRRVSRVVYHTNYNAKQIVNDVAVLTIDPPFTYSAAISPICLAPASSAADQFVDKNAALIGWGITSAASTVASDTLQQTTIPIVSNAKCNETWGSTFSPILNQHICAGADGKDTCHGDSGGPMVVQTKAGSTTWTQVGIVSFGNDCPALLDQPSVYASVAFFRKWIDTYMTS